MFYDADNFIRWVKRVRERGIAIPILPGIMPIATYASFLRRANHMQAKIPQEWLDALEPVKNDDVAVRNIGKTLVANMCRKLHACYLRSSNGLLALSALFNRLSPGNSPKDLVAARRMFGPFFGEIATSLMLFAHRIGMSSPTVDGVILALLLSESWMLMALV
ncbi:hypothetical protein LB505_001293 [Fusarium chuoi]|nr:hypothetical protein LB505_001293 [Fusarium chuoi]